MFGVEELLLVSGDEVAADHFFAAQDYVALDQVFQFANVSRPVILLQHFHQIREKAPGRGSCTCGCNIRGSSGLEPSISLRRSRNGGMCKFTTLMR